MFEKVNPSHPDKIADRIAGALVDYAYLISENPKIAVEVLIGHGKCFIIAETSVKIPIDYVTSTVFRICGDTVEVEYIRVAQDVNLAKNQESNLRCGDNGIFRGVPITSEQNCLSDFVKELYKQYPFDGKFIANGNKLIACQSNYVEDKFDNCRYDIQIVNPLGYWTGGINVDSGATNRKLGSDMGDAVTGGGLHGKDLSKADVSVNIYAHIKAQESKKPVEINCAIGDEFVDGIPYYEVVNIAKDYINKIGGFEKFAEWGLI